MFLVRIDPAINARRYYAIEIAPTLFGGWSVVREWGRIGASCRRRIDLCDELGEAAAQARALVKAKRARGYRAPET